MSKAIYLCIPGVRVIDYRANAGAYVVGAPQPTAVAGLAHALALRLADEGLKLEGPVGVAYAVSEYSGLSGISRNQQSKYKADEPAGNPAIDDRSRASVTLSLLVELVVAPDTEEPSEEHVLVALHKLRLQGASLFGHRAYVGTDPLILVRKMPADAFFLVDARDDMDVEEQTTADALLDKISRPKDSEEYKPRWVPVLAGWRVLKENIKMRPRRNLEQYSLVEPVLGLARFQSRGSFRCSLAMPESPVFWRHSVLETPDKHYVAQGGSAFIDEIEF